MRLDLSLVRFCPNVNHIGYCSYTKTLCFSNSSDHKLYYHHCLVVFTKDEVAKVLKECHDDPGTGGLSGVRRTPEKVIKSYHLETLRDDVKKNG